MAQSVICCLIGLKRVWQLNLIETLSPVYLAYNKERQNLRKRFMARCLGGTWRVFFNREKILQKLVKSRQIIIHMPQETCPRDPLTNK